MNIDLVARSSAGEGQDFAIRAPDGIALVIRMPADIESRPRTIKWQDVYIAVEVGILTGKGQPFAIG